MRSWVRHLSFIQFTESIFWFLNGLTVDSCGFQLFSVVGEFAIKWCVDFKVQNVTGLKRNKYDFLG